VHVVSKARLSFSASIVNFGALSGFLLLSRILRLDPNPWSANC
jgi:hypothetical protein